MTAQTAAQPGLVLERPWADLVADSKDGVLIRARLLSVPKGYAVEFRNDGSTRAAFNFILKGIITRSQGESNGVISLDPGAESGTILVPVSGGHPPFASIEMYHIRLGYEDQGLLWRE